MRYEKHCARCLELLGNEFNEVHWWLDELANKPADGRRRDLNSFSGGRSFGPLDPYHRKYRHNYEGIDHVFKTWGPEAAEAAKLHILDDFFGPCPHTPQQESQIPADERDYVRRGWV